MVKVEKKRHSLIYTIPPFKVIILKLMYIGKSAGSPVVKTQCFHCYGPRFDPWSGN